MYLDAVVEKVNEALSRFPSPGRPEIVFSAHSIPMSVIEKGDPYQRQIEETVRLLERAWRMEQSPPALLPEQSGRQPLAAAFPAPHSSTTRGRASARDVRRPDGIRLRSCRDPGRDRSRSAGRGAEQLGFTQFEMSAGLNDSPKFIQALGQIVQDALAQAVPLSIPIRSVRGGSWRCRSTRRPPV